MPPENQQKQSYFHNWISVLGIIFSVIWFVIILFLWILDFTAKEKNPYLGVVIYFFLPMLLTFSLVVIPLGAWRERKKRLRGIKVRRFPIIDFNNPHHQQLAYTIWGIVTLFFLFTLVGVYQGYHFTESNEFCGKLCHEVMKPEFVAYSQSPHARVKCVECHIGPGVNWFVRSKLSGTYQVFSVLAKKYPRPIETPVKNLRPAQETCEECHWPRQFYGAVERNHQYYMPDEKNSPWQTRLLIRVGGGVPPYGKEEGIHWHMNIKDKVYYIASDDKRQVIPWIKTVSPDGKERIFVDKTSKFTAANPPDKEMRLMDCMDCHNRPSHVFKSPSVAIDEAMAYGAIDQSLPYIKREAVKALFADYSSQPEAKIKIQQNLENFYQKNYPQEWSEKKENINKAVQSIIQIYGTNFFPEMKVSWKEYPNNIGHWIFPGCFRCHDENHKTEDGTTLSRECNTCHTIIEQGAPDSLEKNAEGLSFRHPEEDESWKEMSCSECHEGK
jgi:hypothetical protein